MSAPVVSVRDDWNPRYVAFARANKRTPDEQVVFDRKAYPGGSMTGFILWISERRREFFEAHPEAFLSSAKGDSHAIADTAAWDRWLGIAP